MRCYDFVHQFFQANFCLWNLSPNFSSVILGNYESSNWLYFLYWLSLDVLIQLQCLVDKTMSCLKNVYLEVFIDNSSIKKMFLKILQNLESTCAGSLQFYQKEAQAQGLSCVEFCEIFKNTYFVKHLWTTASVNVGNIQMYVITNTNFVTYA